MGSLSFAKPRNEVPLSPDVQNGIAAGHGLVRPHERRRTQAIAPTLRAMNVFPMTSHVEVVAQLVKSDAGLRKHNPLEPHQSLEARLWRTFKYSAGERHPPLTSLDVVVQPDPLSFAYSFDLSRRAQ